MKAQLEADEDLATYINFAMDGATRLNYLINDLLSYSKINAESTDFTLMDLNKIVNSVLTDLYSVIEESEAVIEVEPLPDAWGDRYLISQVFQNLLGNAIKYRTPNIRPVILISALTSTNRIEIRVKDNGIGIAENDRKRVFEIFQSVSPRKITKSTGIGLAICKKIVQQHKGEIWVESTEGGGSVFCFTLSK